MLREITQNSSPRSRYTEPDSETHARRRLPSRLSRASPAGCPLLVPAFFATIGLVLEVVDHFLRLNPTAITLASLGLAAVIARIGLTFDDYLHVLAATREESLTDSLTGLGNRRALMSDLSRSVSSGEPHLLLLFDLDGFKTYNDRFVSSYRHDPAAPLVT